MTTDDSWRVAIALMWYVANRSLSEFLMFFFDGEKHMALADRPLEDPYVAKWADLWRKRDFVQLFAAMDFRNQQRFVAEVMRVYGEDSERALAVSKAHYAA
jgi:hypothetical protein